MKKIIYFIILGVIFLTVDIILCIPFGFLNVNPGYLGYLFIFLAAYYTAKWSGKYIKTLLKIIDNNDEG